MINLTCVLVIFTFISARNTLAFVLIEGEPTNNESQTYFGIAMKRQIEDFKTFVKTSENNAHSKLLEVDSTGEEGWCPPLRRVQYTGAVTEYTPYTDWTDGGIKEIFQKNTAKIKLLATEARLLGADVFVTPEHGLIGIDYGRNHSIFEALAVEVPEVGKSPCLQSTSDEEFHSVIRELSCTAKSLQLYVVVDLLETSNCPHLETGPCFYNTQVVFSRNGSIAARYRKKHPFLEQWTTPGYEDDSTALFNTDFGVTFSLQICFDIIYEHPAYSNVVNNKTSDVIMSTAWINEMPFHSAISIQQSWSRAVQANLLIANYHWPEVSKMGSGIYKRDLDSAYTYSATPDTILIASPISTCASNSPVLRPRPLLAKSRVLKLSMPDHDRKHVVTPVVLSDFNTTILRGTSSYPQATSLCSGPLCCSVQYELNMTECTKSVFRLMAYSGDSRKGDNFLYMEYCAVVACPTNELNSCVNAEQVEIFPGSLGPVTLTGTFISDVVFPTTFKGNSSVLKEKEFSHEYENGVATMRFNQKIENITLLALIGRKFSSDKTKYSFQYNN